jgi:ABC-type Na+ transport system ATPase subunit NatA
MIRVNDIHKSYTKTSETIKGVSFEIGKGTIFGLLGPNGAGKTTLMQIIATLMKPTSGTIEIAGLDPCKDLLEKIIDRQGLSARAYTRIIKIARTIADLAGITDILPEHLAEAASYRFLDRRHIMGL